MKTFFYQRVHCKVNLDKGNATPPLPAATNDQYDIDK